MIKSNFHTHTLFCDGKDSPEDMVKTAIEKGFTSLGFSGHAYSVPEADFSMSEYGMAEYRKVISALKEEYKAQIKIFCGIEKDYFSEVSDKDYDYSIGSVHFVYKNGCYRAVDESAEITRETVDKFYGGDFDLYAEEYFNMVSSIVEKTNCDIIGHFDLVSKYSEQNGYGQSDRFLKSANIAIKKLVKYKKPFEINTGAMARGVRSVPYPTKEILKMILDEGGKFVFSSDCHNKENLDFAFPEAEKLAKDCGFTEYEILTENGFCTVKL